MKIETPKFFPWGREKQAKILHIIGNDF